MWLHFLIPQHVCSIRSDSDLSEMQRNFPLDPVLLCKAYARQTRIVQWTMDWISQNVGWPQSRDGESCQWALSCNASSQYIHWLGTEVLSCSKWDHAWYNNVTTNSQPPLSRHQFERLFNQFILCVVLFATKTISIWTPLLRGCCGSRNSMFLY